MYRIALDAKTSQWVIQLLMFGFFWISIKKTGKPLSFDTFDHAASFVAESGINKAYECQEHFSQTLQYAVRH